MLSKTEIKETIEAVKNGDASAFETLYDAYSEAMYGISFKILKDQKTAEDAVQDAFVKIWSKIHSFDSTKGSFFTWILNINRNTAIDIYRKTSKKTLVSIQNESNYVTSKLGTTSQNTEQIGISDLLKVLPAQEQEIIEYMYFKGFTQKETAEALNIPLGTVKTRSRKALKGLKELFILLATWI